jgi:hypothetical protein
VKLESPNTFNCHQNVEVTSVNWEDHDAATCLTRLLVSYRWHGIVYAIESLQKFPRISHSSWPDAGMCRGRQFSGDLPWRNGKCGAFLRVCTLLIMPYSSTLSISPDGRFAATCGKFINFEVRALKSGAVRSMQCQVPSFSSHRVGNSKTSTMRVTPMDVQHMCTEKQSVCFAHEGFAVAGSANESKVYIWDAECGDQLLTLDHGGEFVKFERDDSTNK